jgi:hypothetical protein
MSGTPGQDFLALTSNSTHASPIMSWVTGVVARCCLCRDAQPRDPAGIHVEATLAHEAGHALDEDDITDPAKKDHLMWNEAHTQTGFKIPSLTAFDMVNSIMVFPP